MAAFGFSLNNLSLFGLVLAIGIVVDDAIVVVENIERYIEDGFSPREAAYKTMGRGQRSARRHRAGAVGRVYPGRLYRRDHWPILPSVCCDHRRGNGLFSLRIADAVTSFGGIAVEVQSGS